MGLDDSDLMPPPPVPPLRRSDRINAGVPPEHFIDFKTPKLPKKPPRQTEPLPISKKDCAKHAGMFCAAKDSGHYPEYYNSLYPVSTTEIEMILLNFLRTATRPKSIVVLTAMRCFCHLKLEAIQPTRNVVRKEKSSCRNNSVIFKGDNLDLITLSIRSTLRERQSHFENQGFGTTMNFPMGQFRRCQNQLLGKLRRA